MKHYWDPPLWVGPDQHEEVARLLVLIYEQPNTLQGQFDAWQGMRLLMFECCHGRGVQCPDWLCDLMDDWPDLTPQQLYEKLYERIVWTMVPLNEPA